MEASDFKFWVTPFDILCIAGTLIPENVFVLLNCLFKSNYTAVTLFGAA